MRGGARQRKESQWHWNRKQKWKNYGRSGSWGWGWWTVVDVTRGMMLGHTGPEVVDFLAGGLLFAYTQSTPTFPHFFSFRCYVHTCRTRMRILVVFGTHTANVFLAGQSFNQQLPLYPLFGQADVASRYLKGFTCMHFNEYTC